jgi:hypothetical protein
VLEGCEVWCGGGEGEGGGGGMGAGEDGWAHMSCRWLAISSADLGWRPDQGAEPYERIATEGIAMSEVCEEVVLDAGLRKQLWALMVIDAGWATAFAAQCALRRRVREVDILGDCRGWLETIDVVKFEMLFEVAQ